MCTAIEAVAGTAVDVCLAGEGQVTALCGLPEAQLTMAHLGMEARVDWIMNLDLTRYTVHGRAGERGEGKGLRGTKRATYDERSGSRRR